MPAIKITLHRLIELFGKSVNDAELPASVRSLAARLMTLTAHTIRIDTNTKTIGEQVTALTEVVQELAKRQGLVAEEAPAVGGAVGPAVGPPPSQTPPVAAPAQRAPQAKQAVPKNPVEQAAEEDADDLEKRLQAEAQAEVDAINAGRDIDVAPLHGAAS